MASTYSKWRLNGAAPILSMDELVYSVYNTQYLICVVGDYSFIQSEDVSCLLGAKRFNSVLVVLVSGSKDLKNRCQVVSTIKGVDFVVPLDGQTIFSALEFIQPGVFAKGGNRVDPETISEWDVCKKNRIRVVTGVN